MKTPQRDPVATMMQIASKFMDQAEELDQLVEAAIRGKASQTDIVVLRNLASTDRLRALSACQAAAPFIAPKLSAVEFSPATAVTRDRFAERLEAMEEDEILAHLARIADGTLKLEHLEADDGC
jgi:hypothetical protein